MCLLPFRSDAVDLSLPQSHGIPKKRVLFIVQMKSFVGFTDEEEVKVMRGVGFAPPPL